MVRKESTLPADQPDRSEVRMQRSEDVSEILHLHQKAKGLWKPLHSRRAWHQKKHSEKVPVSGRLGVGPSFVRNDGSKKGIDVSLRTVERHVTRYR